MNIEEVAHSDPDAIITTPISYANGLSDAEAYEIAVKIGVESESSRKQAASVFQNLYKIFKEKDATQIEINPMGELEDGTILWCAAATVVCESECLPALLTFSPFRPQHGRQVWLRRERRVPPG